MTDLTTLIANSIKDTDKSWFNEDYTKQALGVLGELRAQGWELCPKEPPEALVTFAVDNLPFGRMKPEELIKELYKLMVSNARKFA